MGKSWWDEETLFMIKRKNDDMDEVSLFQNWHKAKARSQANDQADKKLMKNKWNCYEAHPHIPSEAKAKPIQMKKPRFEISTIWMSTYMKPNKLRRI